MEIRPYEEKDQVQLTAFIDGVLKEFDLAFSNYLDRDLLDVRQYYWNRGGQVWVLVDDGAVVGSIAVSRISDTVCKLRHFYVAKAERGQGWGHKLYRVALDFAHANGYREIWLSTSGKFVDAIVFYEKAGFRRSLKPLWHYRRASIFYVLKLS